ncbi:helix-turn-helix transcriptional regulator [Gemmatimonas sp.]|uniref:helix-turn-helix transcriptional regulator n=1 Tax=Gemmatimonas sp. TaxID=1962908 RepID=UPI00333F6865
MSEAKAYNNVQGRSLADNDWPPERVLDLRQRTGLSQADFGQRIGVKRQTINEWELGKAKPSKLKAPALVKLSREFPPPITGSSVATPQITGHATGNLSHSADYWRGVLFAAETMSETVTALLRQQREAADRLAADRARLTTQRSAASVPTPDRSSG